MQFAALIWGASSVNAKTDELTSTVTSLQLQVELAKTTNIQLQVQVARLETEVKNLRDDRMGSR